MQRGTQIEPLLVEGPDMTQMQRSTVVSGNGAELVLGDLFESDARLLVAPCSVTGTMSAEVRNHVIRLGAALPVGPFTPGQVVAAPTRDTASGTTVLFAMVARSGGRAGGSSVHLVRSAASRIGEFASRADTAAAVPLLAAGAGALPPEESMRAMIAGFRETAHPDARLRIYVRSERLVELLQPLLSEPAAKISPTDSGEQPTAAPPYTDSLERLVQRYANARPVTAGALAGEVIAMEAGDTEHPPPSGTSLPKPGNS
jgi:hypothetical protein